MLPGVTPLLTAPFLSPNQSPTKAIGIVHGVLAVDFGIVGGQVDKIIVAGFKASGGAAIGPGADVGDERIFLLVAAVVHRDGIRAVPGRPVGLVAVNPQIAIADQTTKNGSHSHKYLLRFGSYSNHDTAQFSRLQKAKIGLITNMLGSKLKPIA